MSTAEGRRYVRTDRFATLKDHVYSVVLRAGIQGATVEECVRAVNSETHPDFTAYSNPVSGALSRLHNVDERILRLHERRAGFNVYVLREHLMGRDYYLPRPPDGREGDRLTPALVLEVLDGIGRLHEIEKENGSITDIMRSVWRHAKMGKVDILQAAVDDVRGRT